MDIIGKRFIFHIFAMLREFNIDINYEVTFKGIN